MKKLLGITLSMFLALPAIALAQDAAAQSDNSQNAAQSQSNDTMGQSGAKAEGIKGTISQDGKTLVGDDGKSWTIANPDAVKGHEGHHVVLKGSADASTNQIQVSSVKMMKEKGSKKDGTQPQ
jgi:membrane protein implicated in regulation of membrane protease activity